MQIETTINISIERKLLLEKKSQTLKISKNRIAQKLLKKFSKKNYKPKLFKRLAYQKRNKYLYAKPMHLYMEPEFYEICMDLKKIYKLSLSFILAIAIDKYIQKIKGKPDNYTILYDMIVIKKSIILIKLEKSNRNKRE